ncbi:major facilitator super transporter protein [Ascosphaera aggregata]|nr:major facilitator super transporter protein [Ascosphaera aggregata]
MPRVKAMTTGSVPSFVDVILNFAESDTTSTLSHQDTWLAQIKARRPASKLLMYGDDTWLKLFPNFFDRHDGTSSFFVSDFVEVDNNVTRHIPEELAQSDWTAVIMHYLGLDHIGHKAGPGSPHMIPKQREMDGIVEQVYTSMTTEPHLSSTLFVLCGDHGMNDGGNHGGSSPGETSPALVFISPHLQKLQEGKENLQSPLRASEDFQFYDKVEQSDIAPTLAGLLDLAVPLNSLGVFIPSLLRLWDDRPWKKVLVLLANARQLLNIVKMKFPHGEFDEAVSREECEVSNGSEAGDLACLWSRAMTAVERGSRNKSLIPDACDALLAFSRKAQRVMSNVASNYNVRYMMIAIGLGVVAIGLSVFAAYAALRQSAFASAYFLATSFAYVGMMFASSYVEEEQQFWHWILSGWNLYLLVKW